MANRLLRQKVGLGAIAAAVGLWAPAVTKVSGVDNGKIRIQARVADGEDAVVTYDITGAFMVGFVGDRLHLERV